MKRLLAVACVVWMAACSTAPSATTASGPDDTQAPATTGLPPTTSTAVATTTTEAEPALVEVEIENFRFVPAEVMVRVGDTVRWSTTSGTHTTTADGAVWSSPAMARGESFAWTFDAPGTFDYFCAIHPGMRGTITVEG